MRFFTSVVQRNAEADEQRIHENQNLCLPRQAWLLFAAMTDPNVQVRRATIEDLAKLTELWQQEGLPVEEFARRFQEFQVVELAGESMLGAVGLKVAGTEGWLHSEVFGAPEFADLVREQIWERVQIVAKNHGLVRVWTQHHAPMWHQLGFKLPSADVAQRRPAAFSGPPAGWTCVQLKDDTGPQVSIDKEFAVFKEMQHAETQKIYRQARTMKIIAAIVVLIVMILVVFWAFAYFKAQNLRR